jgi:hypothetical protein
LKLRQKKFNHQVSGAQGSQTRTFDPAKRKLHLTRASYVAQTSFERLFRSETGNLSGERRSKIEGYDLDGWPIIPEDLSGSVACKELLRIMRLARDLASLLVCCLLVFPFLQSRAEETSRAASRRIHPQALEILKRMSTTLGEAKAFTFRSRSVIEVPIRTGQFITLFSSADVALKRPDKLRARLRGEAPHFDFYFDGTNASAFAPGGKVYSAAKAPPTIDTMLPDLEQETGIRFASAPLLFSEPYEVLTRRLISGVVVGSSAVHGIPCYHLAFRSPGVNWEIWIEAGKRALPWRLAVTFTDRPNFPRTLVEFTRWNLHPWLNSRDFVFHKPAGGREIPFIEVIQSRSR